MASSSPPSESSSGQSVLTGLVVGIAIGGVLVLALLSIIFICCKKKKRKDNGPANYYIPPPSRPKGTADFPQNSGEVGSILNNASQLQDCYLHG